MKTCYLICIAILTLVSQYGLCKTNKKHKKVYKSEYYTITYCTLEIESKNARAGFSLDPNHPEAQPENVFGVLASH